MTVPTKCLDDHCYKRIVEWCSEGVHDRKSWTTKESRTAMLLWDQRTTGVFWLYWFKELKFVFFLRTLVFCLLVRTDLGMMSLWLYSPWRGCDLPFPSSFRPYVYHELCPFASESFYFRLFCIASHPLYECIYLHSYLYPGIVCNLHTWLGNPGASEIIKNVYLHVVVLSWSS